MQNLRKRLLEIIELFSGLPDINEMRTKTLELIRTLVWFDRSIFWLFDPLQHEPFASPVYKDMSATIIDRFNALGGFNADMAYQAARQKNIMLGRSTDILDYRIWTRQPIFNELFLPNDAYYQLGCNICEGFRLYGAICLYRGKTTGNFKPRDLHIMSMIYPHLLNRLRLQFCFETKMMRDDSLAELAFILTRREMDIARLVCTGASNQEIALRLSISINTVKMYLQNIYAKLGINRRSQLIILGSKSSR